MISRVKVYVRAFNVILLHFVPVSEDFSVFKYQTTQRRILKIPHSQLWLWFWSDEAWNYFKEDLFKVINQFVFYGYSLNLKADGYFAVGGRLLILLFFFHCLWYNFIAGLQKKKFLRQTEMTHNLCWRKNPWLAAGRCYGVFLLLLAGIRWTQSFHPSSSWH